MADGDSKLEPVLRQATGIAIPVIVLGEYKYGFRQSRHKAKYERWLAAVVADCRILALDESTAEEYARIRSELRLAGRPIPANDLWIAALARQHSLKLVSRDIHFDGISGLQRVGW
jgi:predicted nucleic acid-binding protein